MFCLAVVVLSALSFPDVA